MMQLNFQYTWCDPPYEPNDWVYYVDANDPNLILGVDFFYNPERDSPRVESPIGGWIKRPIDGL